MNDELATTTAVIRQMPRLIEKYGIDKTGEILGCITELFKVMGQHEKDVCAEAFATIVKIGNDANKEDAKPS